MSKNICVYWLLWIISTSKCRNKCRGDHHNNNSLSVAAVLQNSMKHVYTFGCTLEHYFRSHGFAANCGRQVIESCKFVVYECVRSCCFCRLVGQSTASSDLFPRGYTTQTMHHCNSYLLNNFSF